VILECVVSLGKTRLVNKAGDWSSKLRQLLYGYDSVALTFLEGGIEYVVYDPKRVRSLKVHQVLHTSTSSGEFSTESSSGSSSSFRISTATDPGYGSSTCSSSGSCSEAGSSGNSVSGDSSDGGAGEAPGPHARAVCCCQLGSRLRHYAGSGTASSGGGSNCISCSSSSPGCQAYSPTATLLPQLQQQLADSTQVSPAASTLAQQQQQQSAETAQQETEGCASRDSCHTPLQHAHLPDSFQQQQQQDAWHRRLGAEHMVVFLGDAQQASCGKQLAASRADSSCRQLVGM
jgi:hypothetical protein